jgi:hypothetical protein
MDDPANRGRRTDNEALPPEEAQRRLEKLVQTALNTPPKLMKDMPRKKTVPKIKPGKSAKASS